MRTVYYDISRLVANCTKSHPTGIDRVDINHAYYFASAKGYKFIAVLQKNGVLCKVDNQKTFLQNLYRKWINGKIDGFDFDISSAELEAISESSMRKKYNFFRPKNNSTHNCETISRDLWNIIENTGRADKLYFNSSHYGIDKSGMQAAYFHLKHTLGVKVCFYLHDLIPIDFPEYTKSKDFETHHKRVCAMCLYGNIIFCNSDYTKNRLEYFAKRNDLKLPNIAVNHIGAESTFAKEHEAQDIGFSKNMFNEIKLPARYFLYVSTIEPRKNHVMLLNIWRALVSEGHTPPKLILVGKRGWENTTTFNIIDQCRTIKDYIVELNDVPDYLLRKLMDGAIAMLYPSFVEGWGMPIVEAITMKKPVICSDIPPHVEASQACAFYIDPLDTMAWKDAILNLGINNADSWQFTNKFDSFKAPTWSQHFSKMQEELDRIPEEPALFRISDQRTLGLLRESYINRIGDEIKCAPKNCGEINDTIRLHPTSKAFLDWVIGLVMRISGGEKKFRKLLRDPIKFCKDSRRATLRYIGEILNEI